MPALATNTLPTPMIWSIGHSLNLGKTMLAATFWANHKPSESRAVVEFRLRGGKVHLTGVYFLRGNTIDINAVRSLYKQATNILLSGGGNEPWLSPVG